MPVTVFSADGEKAIPVDMRKSPPIDGRFISLGEYRFEKAGQSFVIVSNEETVGHVTPDAVVFLSAEQTNAARKPAAKKANPATDAVKALEDRLKALQRDGPRRPTAISVVEEKVIEDTRVHVRGIVHNLGEPAPRGFLRVATTGPIPKIPADQSGRKELADWVASKGNPLTARVIVNRTWHWLFGSGIVRTVDNFGTTGEPPSHPELLDHLAVRFVEDGWSVKMLVRSIVLSRTYRQSAIRFPHSAITEDPENRLFGRADRRRLEAECIRDAMLAVSGKLSGERGGPTYPPTLAADYGYRADDTRRSVYLPAFRNSMPDLLAAFDAADPSLVTGRRDTSTVAPQALVLLNHPFVIEQSKHAASRLLAEKLPDDAARLTRAYRLVLGREPATGEQAVAGRFLREHEPVEAWAAIFHALFASAEFRFVD